MTDELWAKLSSEHRELVLRHSLVPDRQEPREPDSPGEPIAQIVNRIKRRWAEASRRD